MNCLNTVAEQLQDDTLVSRLAEIDATVESGKVAKRAEIDAGLKLIGDEIIAVEQSRDVELRPYELRLKVNDLAETSLRIAYGAESTAIQVKQAEMHNLMSDSIKPFCAKYGISEKDVPRLIADFWHRVSEQFSYSSTTLVNNLAGFDGTYPLEATDGLLKILAPFSDEYLNVRLSLANLISRYESDLKISCTERNIILEEMNVIKGDARIKVKKLEINYEKLLLTYRTYAEGLDNWAIVQKLEIFKEIAAIKASEAKQ